MGCLVVLIVVAEIAFLVVLVPCFMALPLLLAAIAMVHAKKNGEFLSASAGVLAGLIIFIFLFMFGASGEFTGDADLDSIIAESPRFDDLIIIMPIWPFVAIGGVVGLVYVWWLPKLMRFFYGVRRPGLYIVVLIPFGLMLLYDYFVLGFAAAYLLSVALGIILGTMARLIASPRAGERLVESWSSVGLGRLLQRWSEK